MEWVKWFFVGILIVMLISILVLFIKVKRWNRKTLVRCKNCQHQDDLQFEVGGKFVCRKGHGWNTNDFFCADGEPRKPKGGETDG